MQLVLSCNLWLGNTYMPACLCEHTPMKCVFVCACVRAHIVCLFASPKQKHHSLTNPVVTCRCTGLYSWTLKSSGCALQGESINWSFVFSPVWGCYVTWANQQHLTHGQMLVSNLLTVSNKSASEDVFLWSTCD